MKKFVVLLVSLVAFVSLDSLSTGFSWLVACCMLLSGSAWSGWVKDLLLHSACSAMKLHAEHAREFILFGIVTAKGAFSGIAVAGACCSVVCACIIGWTLVVGVA